MQRYKNYAPPPNENATAKHRGLMTAAQAALLAHLSDASNNTSLINTTGDMIVSGKQNAFLAANATFSSGAWQRQDIASAAAVLQLVKQGSLYLLSAPAGANPISTFATITAEMTALPNGGRFAAPNGYAMFHGKTGSYVSDNLYYDGTQWYRYDTARPGAILGVAAANIVAYYVGAGANPATLLGPYTISTINMIPIPKTAIPLAAGWSSYSGWPCYYHRDILGYVHLEGLAQKSSAIVAGELVGTLPSGVRPGNSGLSLISNNSSGAGLPMSISSNGAINSYAGGATYVSFSAINYLAEN